MWIPVTVRSGRNLVRVWSAQECETITTAQPWKVKRLKVVEVSGIYPGFHWTPCFPSHGSSQEFKSPHLHQPVMLFPLVRRFGIAFP